MKFKKLDERFPSKEERHQHYGKHVLGNGEDKNPLPKKRNPNEDKYEENAYKLAIKPAKGTNPYESSENILGFVRCDRKKSRVKYRKDMNELVIYFLEKPNDASFENTITTTYFAIIGPKKFQSSFYDKEKEIWRNYLIENNPGVEITDIDVEKYMKIPGGI